MKRQIIKIRLYLTLLGLVIFYTVIHEFAYRRYKLPASSILKNIENIHSDIDTLDIRKKTEDLQYRKTMIMIPCQKRTLSLLILPDSILQFV